VSCWHGAKGVRKLITPRAVTASCRVVDVVAWIIGSQNTPPEAVDLLHQGRPMNMHSGLLEYDIVSTPIIDAILSYPDEQKEVYEHKTSPDLWKMASNMNIASLPIVTDHMLDPQRDHTDDDGKAIEILRRLKEHAAEQQPHQASYSTLIHVFVLVLCFRRGVHINFNLYMGQSTPCLKVSDIKSSLIAQLEVTLCRIEPVLEAAEVLVMYTSARYTPLDDDHSLGQCGVPSELCAIVSL